MKILLTRLLDYLLGIGFCFGFMVFLWTVASAFISLPAFNRTNLLFLLLSVCIPWVINFIFNFTSHLYIKGILHGVVWFILDIILYNLFYSVALGAEVLIVCAFSFAAIYALLLWWVYTLSSKLNVPVRSFSAFCGKLRTRIENK